MGKLSNEEWLSEASRGRPSQCYLCTLQSHQKARKTLQELLKLLIEKKVYVTKSKLRERVQELTDLKFARTPFERHLSEHEKALWDQVKKVTLNG